MLTISCYGVVFASLSLTIKGPNIIVDVSVYVLGAYTNLFPISLLGMVMNSAEDSQARTPHIWTGGGEFHPTLTSEHTESTFLRDCLGVRTIFFLQKVSFLLPKR